MTFRILPPTLSVASVLAAALAAAPARAQQMPPRASIEAARQIVIVLVSQVQSDIQAAQSGSGGGGQASCYQDDNPRTCNATPGCAWMQARGANGYCTQSGGGPVADDVDENDHAAEYALQGLASGLFQLGNLIDQANASWGTPAFWVPWQQACQRDGQLVFGAQAGKVSAQLPQQGFVTPADFDSIEDELQQVRADLFCP